MGVAKFLQFVVIFITFEKPYSSNFICQ